MLLDFKKSQGPARIFAPILLLSTKPFAVDKEYYERQAWKSMEKYFEKTSYFEGWDFCIFQLGRRSYNNPRIIGISLSEASLIVTFPINAINHHVLRIESIEA